MKDTLYHALRARLPVVRVTTRDMLNAEAVVRAIAEEAGLSLARLGDPEDVGVIPAAKAAADVLLTLDETAEPTAKTYGLAAATETSVVFVNCEANDVAFDAGELPVPMNLIHDFLSEALPQNEVTAVMPSLAGLTLKEAGEVVRMAMSVDGHVTPRGVRAMRRHVSGATRGLQPVDVELDFHIVESKLAWWADTNFPHFMAGNDLAPRGLLFSGPSGCGKTQNAKWLAGTWGVSLYRLDLGTVQEKWVGASETNLARALAAVEREEPCVLLIDEVEKAIKTSDDSGVSGRMLGQLLWWLQEHRSRVLTVMTTNNENALPAELWRPGRVDRRFSFPLLDKDRALELAILVCEELSANVGIERLVDALQKAYQPKTTMMSHAAVVQAVRDLVKTKGG